MTASLINKILSDKEENHNVIVFETANNDVWCRLYWGDTYKVEGGFVRVHEKKSGKSTYLPEKDIIKITTFEIICPPPKEKNE